jgi:hypothetical protein
MSTIFVKTDAEPKIGKQLDQTPRNPRDYVTDSPTAKAKADIYTTAPWAKRTELSQLAAPSESVSSGPAAGKSSPSPLFVSLT